MKITRSSLWILVLACGSALPALAQPTMDELWPNQDGLGWSYAQHYESFSKPVVLDNQIRIFFDGVTVAPDGIQAQYLRHEVLSGPALLSAPDDEVADPLLRQLWIARPDLRDRIRLAGASDGPCPAFAPPGSYSVLLNGELAYVKTADEIAALRCNLANTRSWLWLTSNLTLGHAFTLQLIPDLADDVFLHGTIGAIESVTVPAGTFADCVRVDYVVDYGTAECGGAGTYRSETRGSIWYAPGVGPVECREEFIPTVEQTGACGGVVGLVDSRAALELTTATTPVRHTSWGRLKAAYR